mmetsp:Transcript_4855/g.10855  ORF Transcript_4855/g.10855 Transcript_4855/m.10855 type:complete len:348 (-) Transcript_4855:15-1058(-)
MSSGTAMFGNFSSMQEQPAKKKPPKSPKGTIIENPLLKNVQFSSYGGGVSALTTTTRTTTTQQAMSLSRSPLVAMTPNRDNLQQGNQQSQKPAYAKQIATPGPPPRMSLSLMGGMAMPMQMDASAAKEPQMKQQEQRFDTLKTPAALSIPMPGGSTPLLVKKADNDNDSYFKESSGFSSESLVADHWVVAHGYTSSSEFKELLGVLSSYGTIQAQEAGGNWLAVQYESRLSAEKALCCQPILLSNTLCGMTRGTPTLLQSLSSGKGEKHQQDLFPGGGGVQATEPPEQRQHNGKNVDARGTRGILNERDILRLENSAYESRQPYQPNSVCDRVFAWYFGWDEHSHSD